VKASIASVNGGGELAPHRRASFSLMLFNTLDTEIILMRRESGQKEYTAGDPKQHLSFQALSYDALQITNFDKE
jgi:hypothetical protein